MMSPEFYRPAEPYRKDALLSASIWVYIFGYVAVAAGAFATAHGAVDADRPPAAMEAGADFRAPPPAEDEFWTTGDILVIPLAEYEDAESAPGRGK
jgi:hypothetical protein